MNRLPPVHFFAEATVPAGQETTLRSEAMTNRTGQPIEINEIRLSAFLSQTILAATIAFDPGIFVRVRISIGDRPLTNGFVPICMLGKTEQEFSQIAPSNPNSESAAIYVWRLAKPWYLPPKIPVKVEFQHSGGAKYPARCQIGFAGRVISSKRTSATIPYAAAYTSKSFLYTAADSSGTDSDESSERDLVNATKKVLTIDRIISRVPVARVTGGVQIAFLNDRNNASAARLMSVRLVTSRNETIMRAAVHRAVFGDTRSIDCSFTLKPDEFIRAYVRHADGPGLVTPFTTYTAQAFVSIVGSREEGV